MHDLSGDDTWWREASAAGDRLLTVTEAADQLGVTKSRIHQLLSCGHLRGPGLPSGRLRHVPGAGRVSAASVSELIAARRAQRAGSPGRSSAGARPARQREWANLDAVAQAAVQEMKVRLDAARGALRVERPRTRRLLEVAEELVALLRSAADAADDIDDLADGYSAALTQVLTPGDPSSVGDHAQAE